MFILTQLLVAQMLFTCREVFAENSCSASVESDSYRTGSMEAAARLFFIVRIKFIGINIGRLYFPFFYLSVANKPVKPELNISVAELSVIN